MKKVDFVIAWVDGSDPKLQAKRAKFSGKMPSSDATRSTRFASDDEIYFSIASILKYVPYCGKIYVVTDEQSPQFITEFEEQGLCSKGQISVVDHRTVFKGLEIYLPTFNSLSIETVLWRIPELSDHFIYLNDDFFFNAPSNLSDFIENDQHKIYGHLKSNNFLKAKYNLRLGLKKYFNKSMQPKYTFAQMLSAELVGLDQYYEVHHRPHILSRVLFKTYFDQHENLLKKQISHRFRSADQFLPVGLNNHLGILENTVMLVPDIEIAYLKNSDGVANFLLEIRNNHIKFGCIQSLDEFECVISQKVKNAMIDKFKDFLPHSIAVKSKE